MWTANIISNDVRELDFDITVEFSDGIVTKTVPFNRLTDPSKVKQILQNQINQYQAITGLVVKNGLVDFTPADPTPPTAEEVARDKFLADLRLWAVLSSPLGGLINANEEQLVALTADTYTRLSQTYIDAYLPYLGAFINRP